MTSCPFERVGDVVTATVSVHNISSSARLRVNLHGSFEGRIWFDLGEVFQVTTGYNFVTVANVRQPLLRYAATLLGADVDVEFSGELTSGED